MHTLNRGKSGPKMCQKVAKSGPKCGLLLYIILKVNNNPIGENLVTLTVAEEDSDKILKSYFFSIDKSN
jgi:hypothetical protein